MSTNTLGKTSFEVSKIGLGTVEIGLPYGIGTNRLPSDSEAERILRSAVDAGITYIDTARGYGVAEERIGKFGISKLPGVLVGTKCAQFLERGEDPRGPDLEERIRTEVEESLRNLRVETLPLMQLHGGTKEQLERGELADILRRLIEEGKIQHVGIATRGASAPQAAIESGFFETIQTAYSILDQRMSPTVLPQAKANNIGIINRSVLLKGALTPAMEHLPPELSLLKKNAAKASQIADELGMTLPTLALRYVLSNQAITVALVGTVTPAHLESALAAANAGPIPTDVLDRLNKLAIKDPLQVDPANWTEF